MSDLDTYAKTVWAEARGESEYGQDEVAKVIKRRADMDKSYWGGSSIRGVCRQPGQFECWNGKNDIHVPDNEKQIYNRIRSKCSDLMSGRESYDRNGPDHYNNPAKEGYPDWTRNCNKMYDIGGHTFYRSKHH